MATIYLNIETDNSKALKKVQDVYDAIGKKATLKIDTDTTSINNVKSKIENATKGTKITPTIDVDSLIAEAKKAIPLISRDTKVKLDVEYVYNQQLSLASLQSKINEAKKALRDPELSGEKKVELTAGIIRLQSQLTEGKRQIQNYVNTGDKELSRLQRKFDQVGGGFSGLAQAGSALAGAGIVAGITALSSKVVSVSAAFQKYELVLGNVLGSTEEAKNSMKLLQDIASKTPFSLDQITQSYIKMVNRGFKPTSAEITNLGDLASSQGKNLDQLVEALLDAQTGEFERLKEFGVKAKVSGDQVALTFKGVTTTVDKTDDAVKKYILSLGQLDGVQGAMETQSQSFTQSMSSLSDKFDELSVILGSNALPIFSSLARGIASVLGYINQFITANPALGTGISVVIGLIVSLVTVIGGMAALGPVVTALGVAFGGLGIALGPLTAIILGIGALATAISFASNASQEYSQKIDEQTDVMNKLKDKQDELEKKYKSGAISQAQYEEGTKKLSAVIQGQQKIIDQTNNSRGAFFNNLSIGFSATLNAILFYISLRGDTISKNFGIIGRNISKAFSGGFSGLKDLAVFTLNGVLQKTADFVNKYIGQINKFTGAISKLTGVSIGQIGAISAPQISTSGGSGATQFESLASGPSFGALLQQSIADERLKAKAKAQAEATVSKENKSVSGGGGSKSGGSSGGGGGSSKDKSIEEEKKRLEELEQSKKRVADNDKKRIEEYRKLSDSNIEKEKKGIDEINKKIVDNIDKIKALNNEIAGINSDAGTKLAERGLAIENELKQLSQDTSGTDNSTKIATLTKELELIKSNTTESQRAEASRVAGLSVSEKILEARDAEIVKINEKIASLELENAGYRNSLVTQTNDLNIALSERNKIEELYKDNSIRRYRALTNAVNSYNRSLREAQTLSNANSVSQTQANITNSNNTDARTIVVNQNINNSADAQQAIADLQRYL